MTVYSANRADAGNGSSGDASVGLLARAGADGGRFSVFGGGYWRNAKTQRLAWTMVPQSQPRIGGVELMTGSDATYNIHAQT